MTDTSRSIAETFYAASAARDVDTIARLLADDVDWLIQGPIDLFRFLGQRRGREAVLAGYREMGRMMAVRRYEVEALLVDGDRSAALLRIATMMRGSERVLSCRMAQFLRLRAGKICEMRGIIDTFDMVEQTIGRPLEVPLAPSVQAGAPAS